MQKLKKKNLLTGFRGLPSINEMRTVISSYLFVFANTQFISLRLDRHKVKVQSIKMTYKFFPSLIRTLVWKLMKQREKQWQRSFSVLSYICQVSLIQTLISANFELLYANRYTDRQIEIRLQAIENDCRGHSVNFFIISKLLGCFFFSPFFSLRS